MHTVEEISEAQSHLGKRLKKFGCKGLEFYTCGREGTGP